jgi:hypothetical protein
MRQSARVIRLLAIAGLLLAHAGGVRPAGATQPATQPLSHPGLQSLTDLIKQDLEDTYGLTFPGVIVLTGPRPPEAPAGAGAVASPLVNPLDGAVHCGIVFYDEIRRWYDALPAPSGAPGSALDPRRNRELFRAIAHELYHCRQLAVMEEIDRYDAIPDWIAEGAAEWFGMQYAYGRGGVNEWFWGPYLDTPGTDLFDRSYDALGFFALLDQEVDERAELWALLDAMANLPWETAGRGAPGLRLMEEAFALAVGAADADELGVGESGGFLRRWATGVVREPGWGDAWNVVGPGLGAYRPPAPSSEAVGLADPPFELFVAPRRVGYATVELDATAAPVVHVEFDGHGALRWLEGAQDDPVDGTADRWFCLDPGGCACPSGQRFVGDVVPEPRGGRTVTVAATGGLVPAFVSFYLRELSDVCEAEPPICEPDGSAKVAARATSEAQDDCDPPSQDGAGSDEYAGCVAVVNTDDVNVRSGPSSVSEPGGDRLDEGDEVEVRGVSEDDEGRVWVLTDRGWVAADLLEIYC